MNYADAITDEELLKLERKISQEYNSAYADMRKVADGYFATLQDRYDKEYEAYQQGKYTDDEFVAWYRTQVQRGQSYERMCDKLSKRVTESNQVCSSYINDKTPSIYSLNANYTSYLIDDIASAGGFTGDFAVINEQAVRSLMMNDENFTEFRTVKVNPTRDYEWNSGQIRSSLTSGILQGLSIDELSESFLNVMQRNKASAIRNARTSFTSAQNGGRYKSAQEAEKMGIKVQKQWHSMEDAKVRFSHAMLDGQIRNLNETFDNGLMYPADHKGRPEEVYNCRCRMEHILPEYMDDQSIERYSEDKQDGEDYQDWLKRKQNESKNTDKELLGIGKIKEAIAVKQEKTKMNNLAQRWKDDYNVLITSGVKQLNFETVEYALKGFDDAFKEYPFAIDQVKRVKVIQEGVMSFADGSIGLNQDIFSQPVEYLLNMIDDQVKLKHWADNSTIESLAHHETGHAIEWLIDSILYTSDDVMTDKWNNCVEATNIVEEAYNRIQKRGNMQSLSYMASTISKYALDNDSELMAEAFNDCKANGSNANILSKEIKKVTFERLKDIGVIK